jgi:hypothetical protein
MSNLSTPLFSIEGLRESDCIKWVAKKGTRNSSISSSSSSN